ncbi:MAG TPA: DUF2313 domain-containing protein [Selenomonadales bacterium]|nr:DUF2313 domain-containing protein [Selenomonadales bacterium]
MGERAERMVERTPAYYHYSRIFTAIQSAIADDYDKVNTDQQSIGPQLFILTATWGLRYWERVLGLPTIRTDSYDLRRSRVLAAWRGIGNFGTDLVEAIITAYTTDPIQVWLDVSEFVVEVQLTGDLSDFDTANTQIQNIIHAHLGLRYRWKVGHPITPVQDPHQIITMADKTNFWRRAASDKLLWNGLYKFNGSQQFDGLINSTEESSMTAQKHVVVMFTRITIAALPFGADKKFNGRFKFDGSHDFAPFTDPMDKIGNNVHFLRKVGGVVVEKGVL